MIRYLFNYSLLPLVLLLLNPQFAACQTSTTVIDILSQNVEFSYFLRILQKNQFIPYLNRLNNVTLIAPVNSAFVKVCSDEDLGECLNGFNKLDLASYIINQPITSDDFKGYRILETVIDKDFTNPVSSPILTHIEKDEKIFEFNHIDVVEPDLFANSQDSYVQGIDKCFEFKSFDQVLDEGIESNVSYIKSLLSLYERPLNGITLLAPSDESTPFVDYERSYLLSKYGFDDRNNILDSLVINGYHGGDINETVVNRYGNQQNLTSHDYGKHITVNGTIKAISEAEISQDALFYAFEDERLIPNVEFNPSKVLVGLGATSFVDELTLQDLSSLITDNTLEQTIFYVNDASSQVSIQSKSSNLYHFVEERIDDLSKAKTLYNTRLCNSKKFGDSCQKIKIETIGEDSYMLNNNILIESGPIKVGNTVIYLTDDNVRTPSDLLSSVNPVFHCTKSLRMLLESKLSKFSNNQLGYTVFLPCYDSYKDFDLTLNYLKKDATLIQKVLKNFIVEGLVYSDIQEDVELFNLNKEKISIHEISSDDEGLNLRLNNDTLALKPNDDILFSQGVIHPVNKLIIPDDIVISLENIIESSIGTEKYFLEYLKQFELFEDILTTDKDYSLLLPHSFKLKPFDSNSTLERFLKIHTIPKGSLNDLYICDGETNIQTLDPKVNLTCTRVSDNNLFLSIVNGAENGVNVFSKGCTNNNDRACIYLIDKPLNLKWIDDSLHNHISLPGLALGFGILLGSLLMVLVLSCLMLVILRKRKTALNEEETNPTESTTLIDEENNTNDYNTTNNVGNFEAGYSGNANIDPINFPQKRTHN